MSRIFTKLSAIFESFQVLPALFTARMIRNTLNFIQCKVAKENVQNVPDSRTNPDQEQIKKRFVDLIVCFCSCL